MTVLMKWVIKLGFITDKKYVTSTVFKNYRFIKMDLTQKAALMDLFRYERFEVVIHLAAQAGVRYSIENPDVYIKSNIEGFFNILEACRHYPVQHLTYASSSSVYGNTKNVPFSTQDSVDKPISLYAATKKSNELMAYTYSHLSRFLQQGCVFSQFMVHGEDLTWPLHYLQTQLSIIDPLKFLIMVKWNGTLHILMISVEGILRVSIHPPSQENEKPPYALFNIGNSKPIKLMDFIGQIEKHLCTEAKKISYQCNLEM